MGRVGGLGMYEERRCLDDLSVPARVCVSFSGCRLCSCSAQGTRRLHPECDLIGWSPRSTSKRLTCTLVVKRNNTAYKTLPPLRPPRPSLISYPPRDKALGSLLRNTITSEGNLLPSRNGREAFPGRSTLTRPARTGSTIMMVRGDSTPYDRLEMEGG